MPDPAPVDPLSVEIRDAIDTVIDTITDQAHEHLCACPEWPDSCGYLYTRVGLEPVGAEQALEVAVRMGWTPTPAADPAQAGEDKTLHAGQVVRWQFMRRPESEWFTACLDDVHPTGGHDWHGVVVDPGSYPGILAGNDMWLMEDCLTEVPAATAEDGGGE